MSADAFDRDLARLNAELERLGAVVVEPDGFAWIDEVKAPVDLVRTYGALISHGYAAGYIPASQERSA